MSNDANNSVAAGGKETRNALLVGLLLLLLLILAPLYWVERAQQDLTERSRAALRSGGLDPTAFEVRFDGRDAQLVGNQAQAAELGHARRLVERVWGVRTVSTRATPATEPQEPSAAAFSGGPRLPPTSVAKPQPLAETRPEETAAGSETAPAPAPDPEPARVSVAPQPAVAPQPETPPARQTPELAGETAPAQPTASETAAGKTASPASEVQALLPPTTIPGPWIKGREAAAKPAAADPTGAEPQAPAAGHNESAPEPASEPAAASTEHPVAETAPPAAMTVTPPDQEPTPATESPAADAGSPGSEQQPFPEPAAKAAGADGRADAGDLSPDKLLTDWPDLAAVEDLRLEMQRNQVWLRGQVNSLADLQRIEAQLPDSAAGRHVRLDLQLAERSSQELADYLNLVAASFRFRAGTSHFGPSGERAMDRIADTLKSYPGTRLGLAGRAPETVNPQARRVHARHRSGATYRALLKRGVSGQQLWLADFASPFSPMLRQVPVAPGGPGQIQFFSLER